MNQPAAADGRTGAEHGEERFAERLKNWPIPPLERTYRREEAALYALSVGVGHDPDDTRALPYVRPEVVEPLPTFPTVLTAHSPWLFDPANGIDSRAILMRELTISLEDVVPAEGTLVFHEAVDAVWDRGAEKGALVHLAGPLKDKATGRTVAKIERVTLALRNGGFGGPPPPADPRPRFPESEPDMVHCCSTSADAALLFRLHGDLHPLHWDPDFASSQGFPKPLLHGMCTLGIVGHGIVKHYGRYAPGALKSLRMLFKRPVFPADTVRTGYWRDGCAIQFRSWVEERNELVAEGSAQLSADVPA